GKLQNGNPHLEWWPNNGRRRRRGSLRGRKPRHQRQWTHLHCPGRQPQALRERDGLHYWQWNRQRHAAPGCAHYLRSGELRSILVLRLLLIHWLGVCARCPVLVQRGSGRFGDLYWRDDHDHWRRENSL